MEWLNNLFKKPQKVSTESFKEMTMKRAAVQFELLTKNMDINEAAKIDPLSFYLGFISGAKEYACGFKDDDQTKVSKILEWKGEKPEIKQKLDSLKVGEEYFDPKTGVDYECIGKLPNGESITQARSGNWETI